MIIQGLLWDIMIIAASLQTVTAMEKSSGVHADIQVKPSYGLEESQITDMLMSSMQHAKEDMQARMLKEQQVEAARVEEAISAALQADGQTLLNEQERQQIDSAVLAMREAAQQQDPDAIKTAIEQVDKVSQEFANRRMDRSINLALS